MHHSGWGSWCFTHGQVMMLCCLFTGQFADPKSVAGREQFLVQHMLPASPVWPEVTGGSGNSRTQK